MGYSSRYHAASLAAVFLALAVGILIGVGFGSDIVSGTAEDLEQSLASDLEVARADKDALEAALEAEREFGQAVYPAVVSETLRGDEVALIGLGGLDQEIAADVEAALGPAGASLAEVAVVREPPDLDALASSLTGREARAVSRGAEEELLRFAQRAGRSLTTGGPAFDELRRTLLTRYSGRPNGIDAAVVVRQQPADLEPGAEVTTDLLERGLLAGLRSRAQTVGVERTDSDPSSIRFFEDNGIATVDNINLNAGRVALVFALDGAGGNFGVKETADSLLPDLLLPASEASGSAARSAG